MCSLHRSRICKAMLDCHIENSLLLYVRALRCSLGDDTPQKPARCTLCQVKGFLIGLHHVLASNIVITEHD